MGTSRRGDETVLQIQTRSLQPLSEPWRSSKSSSISGRDAQQIEKRLSKEKGKGLWWRKFRGFSASIEWQWGWMWQRLHWQVSRRERMGNPLSLSLVLLFLSFADFGRGGVPTIKGQKGSLEVVQGEKRNSTSQVLHTEGKRQKNGKKGVWLVLLHRL